MTEELKIAFVQDALPFQGGAEKVLAAALEVFPQAPVYTLVYNREAFRGTVIEQHPVFVSFIDKLPGAHIHHRRYLPLMPLAIERFDLRQYAIILSFSYAVAHAAPSHPGQLHISYIHTPMRYAWQISPIRRVSKRFGRLAAWGLKPGFAAFRLWDLAMLKRTRAFVTNSQWMAENIWKAYHRRAEVLYPPVETDRFYPQFPRENYYICLGRLVELKRLDIVVQAFTRLGYPLVVVGEGPEKASLQAIAGPNIQFLGWQPQDQVANLLGKAKAFVHAGEEDFGIALVEAQAAGCPVISFNQGAAPEIIQDGKTGVLFDAQDVESLCAAVEKVESQPGIFEPESLRANALRFDQYFFKQGLENLVREKWAAFQNRKITRQAESPVYRTDPQKAIIR